MDSPRRNSRQSLTAANASSPKTPSISIRRRVKSKGNSRAEPSFIATAAPEHQPSARRVGRFSRPSPLPAVGRYVRRIEKIPRCLKIEIAVKLIDARRIDAAQLFEAQAVFHHRISGRFMIICRRCGETSAIACRQPVDPGFLRLAA